MGGGGELRNVDSKTHKVKLYLKILRRIYETRSLLPKASKESQLNKNNIVFTVLCKQLQEGLFTP